MQKINFKVHAKDYERSVINLRETPNQAQPQPIQQPVQPTPRVEPAPTSEPISRDEPTPQQRAEPVPSPVEASPQPVEPELNFRLSSAYPEITGAADDPMVVRILKRLTAGRCGEFTAVNTYLYQYLILRRNYPEIAQALREISLVEMMHYEMLSEAVVDFGGDPNLTDGQGNVWTGRNINRERDVRRLLLDDIRSEENGIRRLENAASRVNNVSLSELLLRIIEDEKNHVIVLNRLLATL